MGPDGCQDLARHGLPRVVTGEPVLLEEVDALVLASGHRGASTCTMPCRWWGARCGRSVTASAPAGSRRPSWRACRPVSVSDWPRATRLLGDRIGRTQLVGSRQVCVCPACEGFLGRGAGVYPSKMLFLSQLA